MHTLQSPRPLFFDKHVAEESIECAFFSYTEIL